MCGIVAYVGDRKCRETVVSGLERLEYRGYDSAGFVCIDAQHKHVSFSKEAGALNSLKKTLSKSQSDGFIGMGHTRWATHGTATRENAHPHFNCDNSIAVVHNGILESYTEIREALINNGHEFRSSTDTEVAAHFLESVIACHKTRKSAVVDFVQQLKGVYAFVFLMEDDPDRLLLIRRKSPLAVGIGDGEMFAASDPIVFSDKTNKVLFLPDESFAFVSKDSIELYDFNGKVLKVKPQEVNFTFNAANKQGFEHYMLKEIYEQKKAINHTISFYKLLGNKTNLSRRHYSERYDIKSEYQDSIWDQLGLTLEQVRNLEHIHLVAAGTSWHAGRIAQFFFEDMCYIPTGVHLASEFRYKRFFPQKNSVYIVISQSGETADTLEALRLVNANDLSTIALTNVASSTIVREADGFLLMQAGPEISVASTKAFTSQVASLYWLANRIALERGLITAREMKATEEDLFIAAEVLESSIEDYKWKIINSLAPQYCKYDRFIFLGRHISHPFAMEAALKLKEIAYVFAQSYASGELKHGPLALIDSKTPIALFSVLDELIYRKLLANAQEVKARNGHLIVFAFEGQTELISLADTAFVIPRVGKYLDPLAMSGLMQFFIYYISRERGCPIDKPRNLAKSVTVE